MKTLKKDWIIWIIILIPYIFVAWFWNQFPEQIAIHFDLDGKPNGYAGKLVGLILIPGINIALYFLFLVLPKIDPRKKNYDLFEDKLRIIRYAIHAFMSFVNVDIIFDSLGYHFNSSNLVMYGVMTLFLILGNVMGNVRPNFFIGVRTPWTLANEEVWIKTHRLTARIWVFATLLMMVIYPFLPDSGIAFGIYIAIISIIPIVYSYVIFRKIHHQNE